MKYIIYTIMYSLVTLLLIIDAIVLGVKPLCDYIDTLYEFNDELKGIMS